MPSRTEEREPTGPSQTAVGHPAGTSLPPPPGQAARIVVVVGPHAGRKLAIGDGLLVGRSADCDLVLDDPEVSRRHCRISHDGTRLLVEDFGSRNGTHVNSVPVERAELAYGDRVQVGRRSVLLVSHHDPLREALLQRQKMEALGQLGAGIAHDLNNLLEVLGASVDHLEELDPTLPLSHREVRECHRDLGNAVRSAKELTRRLLRFARRGEPLDVGTVAISDLCDDVAHLVRRAGPDTITVECRSDPGLAVRADRGELHQAIMNLCINGRDAMPTGGTLTIEATRAHRADLQDPGLLLEGPLVCLSVTDTGSGMDEAVRERVFEPFFTTKGAASGSGLGLSTTYEVVVALGGHLEVESSPGCGSTFRAYLPAVVLGTCQGPEPPRPAGERRAGRLLLVDDNDLVRRAAARLLRARGHEVVAASGGAEALAICTGPRPPDLVILDLDMPGMSGEELWGRLRSQTRSPRVLFLSGACDEARRQRLLSEGALAFLFKPVDAHVLRDAVADALVRDVRTRVRA